MFMENRISCRPGIVGLYWLILLECLISAAEALDSVSTAINRIDEPEMTSTETISSTEEDWGHRKRCTADERQRAACLNDGQCFALDLNLPLREASCRCLSGWTGQRCELKELPPYLWDATSLGGLIAGLLIFVFFLGSSVIIYFCCKRRKKQNSERGHKGRTDDGEVAEPFNSL